MARTSNLEKIAELHVVSELLRHRIQVAKPYGDEWGGDLLAMLSVYDYAKFVRIQSKGRSLTTTLKSNHIKIPEKYVTDSFIIFLYINQEDDVPGTSQNHLFVFFQEDIIGQDSIFIQNKTNLRLSFSWNTFQERLSSHQVSREKFNKIKTMIRALHKKDLLLPSINTPFEKGCSDITRIFYRFSKIVKCDWNSWRDSAQTLLSQTIISEFEYQSILKLRDERDSYILSDHQSQKEIESIFLSNATAIKDILTIKLKDVLRRNSKSNDQGYDLGYIYSEISSFQRALSREVGSVDVTVFEAFSEIQDLVFHLKMFQQERTINSEKANLTKQYLGLIIQRCTDLIEYFDDSTEDLILAPKTILNKAQKMLDRVTINQS